MIQNIFLVKEKNQQDIDSLNIFNYPYEIITKDINLLENLFYGHNCEILYQESKINQVENEKLSFHLIDTPVPQIINNLNISTICIDGNIIIGIIFDTGSKRTKNQKQEKE